MKLREVKAGPLKLRVENLRVGLGSQLEKAPRLGSKRLQVDAP